MPKFVYKGQTRRSYLYPKSMTVSPGDVIEAEENPDPARFQMKAEPKAAEQKKEN